MGDNMDRFIAGIMGFGTFCIGLLIMGIMVAGWVLNIAKLITYNETAGMLLARAAGIFIAPLGGVLGWL